MWTHHKAGKVIVTLVALAGFAAAHAESGTASSECSTRGDGDAVRILVCPSGLDRDAWRAAGREVCDDAIAVCNAWIWDDPDKAPRQAPVTDTDMSEEHTRHAIAVWVNDSERLMVLRQASQ